MKNIPAPGIFDKQRVALSCIFMDHAAARNFSDGMPLSYAFCPSPLGPLLLGWLGNSLCTLSFAPPQRQQAELEQLRQCWPMAQLKEEPSRCGVWIPQIFWGSTEAPLPLLLRGSAFQLQVWQGLLDIAPGQTISYGQLAAKVGHPGAARAVGTAMATNPIAFLVPCHRVVRSNNSTGHYGGGAELKACLLDWEQKHNDVPEFFYPVQGKKL